MSMSQIELEAFTAAVNSLLEDVAPGHHFALFIFEGGPQLSTCATDCGPEQVATVCANFLNEYNKGRVGEIPPSIGGSGQN